MKIEIDNVELYFKNNRILNGIYLKAETGKITGILGSNGSGKSCLLNIIFGSLNPKYKLIRIDGKPIMKPLHLTGLISFLPQHHFVPKGLRVKSAFVLYNLDWQKFKSYFPSLDYLYNQKMKTLSGGERRLIETFLSLMKATEIVLLDEPFSHLAPIHIETLTELIHQEKQHKAIILTDHLYEQIIGISDTIYLIKNGSTKHIQDLKELEDYKYLKTGSIS